MGKRSGLIKGKRMDYSVRKVFFFSSQLLYKVACLFKSGKEPFPVRAVTFPED